MGSIHSMQSIYSNTPYTNVTRTPSYPHRYPHLVSKLPETQYPYDSVYDSRYQHDIKHPNNQHQNMEYPHWVQRHRMPMVFTERKPRSYNTTTGYSYQVYPYPPYQYFYHNPRKCRDTCGGRSCQKYFKKLNNYNNCKRCQLIKRPGPMCWDPKAQRCVSCSHNKALTRCEDTFGCKNPQGFPHGNIRPINPLYTGCKNC